MANFLPSRAGKVHSENTDATPIPLIDLVAQYDTIRDEVRPRVDEVFERQAFVLGEEVAALESELAEFCDARYAIGCASGTDALILALMAIDLQPGDEVITSPFSFFATASSIHRAGGKPVFVDIDPVTFNIDPELIEAAITDRTKAIMPVHLFGQCADMEPIQRIAAQHGLHIIEDACQAIGARTGGRDAGVLGTVGCFSFFPTKNLGGAGDGGIMTTDDEDIAQRLLRLRVHGDTGGYHHVEVGLNSRLDALQAAVLRIKLSHLNEWAEARRANAQQYLELFRQFGLEDALIAPVEIDGNHHVYNQFTIRIRNGRRDEVLGSLRSQKIGAGVYYPVPLHMQPCFADLGYHAGDFPESEAASRDVISLPIFAELGSQRLRLVVDGLLKALGREQRGPDTGSIRRRAA